MFRQHFHKAFSFLAFSTVKRLITAFIPELLYPTTSMWVPQNCSIQGPPYILARHVMAIFSICTYRQFSKKKFHKTRVGGSECLPIFIGFLNLPILIVTLASNHMGMEKGFAEKNIT